MLIELHDINEDSLSKLPGVAIRYIEMLPQIPYTAVGFNFKCKVKGINKEYVLRTIFAKAETSLERTFGEGYTIGGVIQSYFNDLEIITMITPDASSDDIDMNFNYISPVKDSKELKSKLERFKSASEYASHIATNLIGEVNGN